MNEKNKIVDRNGKLASKKISIEKEKITFDIMIFGMLE